MFLDGPVHQGREHRDQEARKILQRRGRNVKVIKYRNFSKKEQRRVIEEILEAVK